MSDCEAKEILIGLMNYAAFRETPHSLWPTDMNRLFGEKHYPEDRPVYSRSVWEGDQFEQKMAELLQWGTHLEDEKRWKAAIRTLRAGDHYINRVIRVANLENV